MLIVLLQSFDFVILILFNDLAPPARLGAILIWVHTTILDLQNVQVFNIQLQIGCLFRWIVNLFLNLHIYI